MRSELEPNEPEIASIAGDNESIKTHLLSLAANRKYGMHAFLVDDQPELWNIQAKKASLVMVIRTLGPDEAQVSRARNEHLYSFDF